MTKQFSVSEKDVSGDHTVIRGVGSIIIDGSTSDKIYAYLGEVDSTKSLIDTDHIMPNTSYRVLVTAEIGTYALSTKQPTLKNTPTNGTLHVGSGGNDDGGG